MALTQKSEPANPLIRKLEHFVRLSTEDRLGLQRISGEHIRQYRARVDVIHEGEPPQAFLLFLSGWACSYKQLEDGRRQIISLFLPGDCCDLNNHILSGADHSIGAITPITIAGLVPGELAELMAGSLRIRHAMWWESLVRMAIQREWTVNLGQRSAFERVAHLLCELFLRLRSVGLTDDQSCDIPLTQAELADATGLSAVHANRTLQELRATGLIVLKDKVLTVPDLEALQGAALFNASYLHLNHEGRSLDANMI